MRQEIAFMPCYGLKEKFLTALHLPWGHFHRHRPMRDHKPIEKAVMESETEVRMRIGRQADDSKIKFWFRFA
jgi:hypothetical protein